MLDVSRPATQRAVYIRGRRLNLIKSLYQVPLGGFNGRAARGGGGLGVSLEKSYGTYMNKTIGFIVKPIGHRYPTAQVSI